MIAPQLSKKVSQELIVLDIEKSKVLRSSGNGLTHETTKTGAYTSGFVTTPFGLVSVYAQADMWGLRFVWKGYFYNTSTTCEELPSDYALTRRASRFARQIAERDGQIAFWD